MKQTRYSGIRDVLYAKGYSFQDVFDFIIDEVRSAKAREDRCCSNWLCQYAYQRANLNENDPDNDCSWFGSGYGAIDAARYSKDAVDFLEYKVAYDSEALLREIVDDYNDCWYPADPWQELLQEA